MLILEPYLLQYVMQLFLDFLPSTPFRHKNHTFWINFISTSCFQNLISRRQPFFVIWQIRKLSKLNVGSVIAVYRHLLPCVISIAILAHECTAFKVINVLSCIPQVLRFINSRPICVNDLLKNFANHSTGVVNSVIVCIALRMQPPFPQLPKSTPVTETRKRLEAV